MTDNRIVVAHSGDASRILIPFLREHLGAEVVTLTPEAVPPRALPRRKAEVAQSYVNLLETGQWFSPAREALDAFVASIQRWVTGSVRVELFKARCRPLAVRPASNDGRAFTDNARDLPDLAILRHAVAAGGDRSAR